LVNSLSTENKISNILQKDIVKIEGKTVFINPFLYGRQFDENTNRWLREPGQISDEQIKLNSHRFYPGLDWSLLDNNEKFIKYGTVEMFLKTLDLVSKFHPNLNESQLLKIERKMTSTKKNAFEKWVKNSFSKKAKIAINEKRKLQRDQFVRKWYKWFSLELTHQALLPIMILIFISAFIGWSAGISKNSCNPYFESINKNNK